MSTSPETLPRRSPSSSQILVVGCGRGLGVVLRALRELGPELTVIVAAAEYVGPGAPEPGPGPSPALGELRRALEALTDDKVALARAMRRPLTIDRLGRHPLGNLVIHSLASGFGDLGRASVWLGTQLGIGGAVLPATLEPLKFTVQEGRPPPHEPPPAWSHVFDQLNFIPQRPRAPAAVISAVRGAKVILLTPGALFRGSLVAAAVPEIAQTLRATHARIVWICNLEPESGETASDQLHVLCRHGIRVDAALCDPASGLGQSARRLPEEGVETIMRPLRAASSGVHDQQLLRSALDEVIGLPITSTPDALRPGRNPSSST
jgi:uncharacterized cofD-like protein